MAKRLALSLWERDGVRVAYGAALFTVLAGRGRVRARRSDDRERPDRASGRHPGCHAVAIDRRSGDAYPWSRAARRADGAASRSPIAAQLPGRPVRTQLPAERARSRSEAARGARSARADARPRSD